MRCAYARTGLIRGRRRGAEKGRQGQSLMGDDRQARTGEMETHERIAIDKRIYCAYAFALRSHRLGICLSISSAATLPHPGHSPHNLLPSCLQHRESNTRVLQPCNETRLVKQAPRGVHAALRREGGPLLEQTLGQLDEDDGSGDIAGLWATDTCHDALGGGGGGGGWAPALLNGGGVRRRDGRGQGGVCKKGEEEKGKKREVSE